MWAVIKTHEQVQFYGMWHSQLSIQAAQFVMQYSAPCMIVLTCCASGGGALAWMEILPK